MTSATLQHGDDITFLTTGSGPACKTVTEEVALLVLAAHRTFGVTGRWRALVWDIYECEKMRYRERRALKLRQHEQEGYIQGFP